MEGRIERTKKLGADVRKLPLGYDETVIEARQETSKLETKARGKVLFIQDTTLEGYWVIIVINFCCFLLASISSYNASSFSFIAFETPFGLQN